MYRSKTTPKSPIKKPVLPKLEKPKPPIKIPSIPLSQLLQEFTEGLNSIFESPKGIPNNINVQQISSSRRFKSQER